MCRVKGHDVAAGLLVKAVGPQIVNASDAKGRWVGNKWYPTKSADLMKVVGKCS